MSNRKQLLLTIIICLLPAAVGLILYGSLPEQIPVQWGISGDVSSYAPKWFAVLGMPVFFALCDLFCHWKVNKNEFEYPKAMIAFMKYVCPVLSVVCVGASIIAGMM
ncbi:MAG: DUF1648 domain-containing protein [Clostridiales bacterium]|nr:DUF1648 domain-containing protein [Clostridiales bacterium]